jgi:hypothetical protein
VGKSVKFVFFKFFNRTRTRAWIRIHNTEDISKKVIIKRFVYYLICGIVGQLLNGNPVEGAFYVQTYGEKGLHH